MLSVLSTLPTMYVGVFVVGKSIGSKLLATSYKSPRYPTILTRSTHVFSLHRHNSNKILQLLVSDTRNSKVSLSTTKLEWFQIPHWYQILPLTAPSQATWLEQTSTSSALAKWLLQHNLHDATLILSGIIFLQKSTVCGRCSKGHRMSVICRST